MVFFKPYLAYLADTIFVVATVARAASCTTAHARKLSLPVVPANDRIRKFSISIVVSRDIKYVYYTSSDTKKIGERHFGPTVEKYNRFIGQ